MNRVLGVVLIFLLSGIATMAQTVVSGSVADKEGDALAGCSVYFYRGDSIEGGISTDQKGRFELKGLPEGEYVCRVSMIGYKTASRSFTLVGKVKLDRIFLEQDFKTLDEVTVSVDTQELTKERAGMSIYYLSNQARNSMDAYQALQEVPRLVINQTTRSIQMDDGRAPLILVNGVKKPIDVLAPEMIEAVEVIDNASARYLGEGGSAVINLKIKKKSISPYLYGNLNGRSTPNTHFIYSNGSIETGSATSSLYVNGTYMHNAKGRSEIYNDIRQGDIHRVESGQNKMKWWDNPIFNVGGDKEFSIKNYMAYSVNFHSNTSVNESTGDGMIYDSTSAMESPLVMRNRNKNGFKSVAGNIYYRHTFAPSRTLEFTGSYFYSTSMAKGERYEQSSIYSYESSINLDNDRNAGKLKIDYSDMLTNEVHFEAGSHTEYGVTNIDDSLDSWPNYRYRQANEYVYAGIDNNRSNSKFNYVVSVGLDMVFNDASGERNSYIDFVPSVSLGYKLGRQHNLTLYYNRTRMLPSAGQLNPCNTSTDQLIVNRGNPNLKPSHTDMIKFGYVFSNNSFRFNPYVQYSYNSDMIEQYGYLEDNIYINTLRNFGHTSALQSGAMLSYNLPQGKALMGGVNANFSYQKSYIKGMSFSGNSFNIGVNLWMNYKKVSFSGGIGSQGASYTVYTKSRNFIYSNCELGWNVISSLRLSLSAEKFLFHNRRIKNTAINGDYRSYSSILEHTMSPKVCVGVTFSFMTKNFRWRQKKQFYDTDTQLNSITTN